MSILYKAIAGIVIATAFFAYGFADWHFWAVFVLVALALRPATPRAA